MAYDIKNVFYLSTSATVTASATDNQGGSAQLDLSAYIDPIARGRTKGTGLAVYKTHFMVSDSAGRAVEAAEDGIMTMSLQAGLGVGDIATGGITFDAATITNINPLAVATAEYYGPASYNGAMGTSQMTLTPSEKVPYVIVRDNVCLIYSTAEGFTKDALITVRLECAQVSLDQATLNQLLRTQTV